MVPAENFRSGRAFAQFRSQVSLDEGRLFRGGHHHARLVLGIVRLVLWGHRADVNAMPAQRSHVLPEVLCIRRIVFRLQASGHEAAVGLHPGRCRPRRRDDLHGRIDLQDLLQHRKHLGVAGGEIEPLEVALSATPPPIAEIPPAEVGSADGQPQTAQPDRSLGQAKQLLQQGRAVPRRKSRQQIGTAPCQRKAEALDGLKDPAIVDFDRGQGVLRRRFGKGHRLHGLQQRVGTTRDPAFDHFCCARINCANQSKDALGTRFWVA